VVLSSENGTEGHFNRDELQVPPKQGRTLAWSKLLIRMILI